MSLPFYRVANFLLDLHHLLQNSSRVLALLVENGFLGFHEALPDDLVVLAHLLRAIFKVFLELRQELREDTHTKDSQLPSALVSSEVRVESMQGLF